MISKVEVSLGLINYLRKGEKPTVLEKGLRMTRFQTIRGKEKNIFEVSNELVKIWFE